jgi:biopolymer transport protein TolR
MSFSSAGGGASRAQINVTPLIDVLLTLIVMFMLVVAMDKEHGEAAQIPQPPKNGETPSEVERTVVIQVVWTAKDQRPVLKINKEDVPWAQLDERLAKIYFQNVADVIDVAHHAGVTRVGLLTQDRTVE